MIEFQNVSYSHNKGYGVNNLNMLIKNGDFTFLIGPTGSGKTTLMRLLYFDLFPDSGIVKVNGNSSNKMSSRDVSKARLNIGMVFQDYKLLSDRNLYENIALPLHVMGFTSNQIASRVDEAIELVGLEGKESHLPRELSGGEQQRASLARAFIKEPDIILADEPTGALDTKTGAMVMQLLQDITGDTSLIMITHDERVADYCQRKVRLRDGLIESQGND